MDTRIAIATAISTGSVMTAAVMTFTVLYPQAWREACAMIIDAWEEMDLARHLAEMADALSPRKRARAWWNTVTNPELEHGPPPTYNDRQLTALRLARENGRVTNGDLQEYCHYHPETLRQDLATLCARGMLEKRGDRRWTYYVPRSMGGSQ